MKYNIVISVLFLTTCYSSEKSGKLKIGDLSHFELLHSLLNVEGDKLFDPTILDCQGQSSTIANLDHLIEFKLFLHQSLQVPELPSNYVISPTETEKIAASDSFRGSEEIHINYMNALRRCAFVSYSNKK